MLRRGIVFYSRLFLGVMFIMSSLGKVIDLKGFAVQVSDYRILPDFLIFPFACLIAFAELSCGLLLLFGVQLQLAGIATTALMVLFLAAIGLSLTRGLEIDCGCFDLPLFGPAKMGWHTVVRNLIFTALAVCIALFSKEPKKEVP